MEWMERQWYLCDIHTKKIETRMCDIHTHDNGDTQGICVAFTQRKVGQFYSEKETKRFGSPHKRGVCMK